MGEIDVTLRHMMLENPFVRHGDHVCGPNKIIPVWKRNSQLGQGT